MSVITLTDKTGTYLKNSMILYKNKYRINDQALFENTTIFY